MARPTFQSGATAMEFGLHPPAGGIFRVIEAAGQRQPFLGRQMTENFRAFVARHILENRDCVIGLDVLDAFGHGLRAQFVENFLAYCVVDFGQCREVEIDAEQFDQTRPLVGLKRFQERAEIGFVQVADQNAQLRYIDGLDRARGFGDGNRRGLRPFSSRSGGFSITCSVSAGPRRRTSGRAIWLALTNAFGGTRQIAVAALVRSALALRQMLNA